MRIEAYGLNAPPLPVQNGKPLPRTTPEKSPAVAPDSEPVSAQDKLRAAIEEKRWMAEAAFHPGSPEGDLGQHIDLRV
jgi:hypothetical protein